jgi:hypothetical protein
MMRVIKQLKLNSQVSSFLKDEKGFDPSAGVEVEIVDGDYPTAKAEQEARSDVESRVHEIANDVIEEREWATEDLETYDDYEEELEERRGADEDRDDY